VPCAPDGRIARACRIDLNTRRDNGGDFDVCVILSCNSRIVHIAAVPMTAVSPEGTPTQTICGPGRSSPFADVLRIGSFRTARHRQDFPLDSFEQSGNRIIRGLITPGRYVDEWESYVTSLRMHAAIDWRDEHLREAYQIER
jgi:hypothetical protein